MPSALVGSPRLGSSNSFSKTFSATLDPDNNSPIAPGNLAASESSKTMTGSDLEKMLLERLLLRKELRLKTMQERLHGLEEDLVLTKENHESEVQHLEMELTRKEETINNLQNDLLCLVNTPGLTGLLWVIEYLQLGQAWAHSAFFYLAWLVLFPIYTLPLLLTEKGYYTLEYCCLKTRSIVQDQIDFVQGVGRKYSNLLLHPLQRGSSEAEEPDSDLLKSDNLKKKKKRAFYK